MDEQLGVLRHVVLRPGAFLDMTVTEMHDVESETQSVVTAWRTGDAAKLAALLSDEYKSFPALYRLLVTERNKRWVPQIEKLLHGARILCNCWRLAPGRGRRTARADAPRRLQTGVNELAPPVHQGGNPLLSMKNPGTCVARNSPPPGRTPIPASRPEPEADEVPPKEPPLRIHQYLQSPHRLPRARTKRVP